MEECLPLTSVLFHFYKVTFGATLHVQGTRVPGIYAPTGQPLPMTGAEV